MFAVAKECSQCGIHTTIPKSGKFTGANSIEANESNGDADFNMKIKTCRRESKESAYRLRIVITDDSTEQENKGPVCAGRPRVYIHIYSHPEEAGAVVSKNLNFSGSEKINRKQETCDVGRR